MPTAIVYTSKTGFTRQYAQLLGKRLGLPVYSLEDALYGMDQGSPILYLGWIHASAIRDYRKAAKNFSVCAVCGVGLCDTGTLTDRVRKATAIPASIPLFTLQGGFDRSKLKGLDKLMISMLVKGLSAQEKRSEQDERMLALLQTDGNYVSPDNLKGILDWYEGLKTKE